MCTPAAKVTVPDGWEKLPRGSSKTESKSPVNLMKSLELTVGDKKVDAMKEAIQAYYDTGGRMKAARAVAGCASVLWSPDE